MASREQLEWSVLAEFSRLNSTSSLGLCDASREDSTGRGAVRHWELAESDDECEGPGLPLRVGCLLPGLSGPRLQEKLLSRVGRWSQANQDLTRFRTKCRKERDAITDRLVQFKRQQEQRMASSQRDREERWEERSKRSPFAVNLVADSERSEERSRHRVEERRQRRAELLVHGQGIEDLEQESREEEFTRARHHAERRQDLEEQKRLKAQGDVERSTQRIKQLLAEQRERPRLQ